MTPRTPPAELVAERLRLCAASPSDAAAIVQYHERNREHFARWDPPRPADFYSELWWRERIENDARLALEDRSYRFFLFLRDDPQVSGMVHFANVVRGAFQSCHLGFAIDAALQGRGLMREALERAIAWAFDEARLHRIEANHRPENVRSAALLRRLGFVPQGYARDYLFIDGAWRDHVLNALLDDRWADRA